MVLAPCNNNEYEWLNAKDSKRLKISYPFFRDASKINPNNCSYNEWMVLNVEAHISPSDCPHAAVWDKSGTDSYF